MSKSVRSSVVLAAAVGFAALLPSLAQAAECRAFVAVGSGITESVAQLMAKQGAINLAENRGWTVKGDAKLLKCVHAGTFGNECQAKSYACKLPQ
jgi:hypothetical protein